jgi:hypothetical protein
MAPQLIHRRPPEARGRSERMFGTLQDRLIKELAKAGITEIAAANACPEPASPIPGFPMKYIWHTGPWLAIFGNADSSPKCNKVA